MPSRPTELLPSWDASRPSPTRAGRRAPAPGGTFGLRVLGVTEVTRADPRRVRADDAPARPVGRGRGRPGHGVRAGHAYFTLKDARSPAPVRLVPRRPRALAVPAADRAAGRRPRAHRRVRAAGRSTSCYVESLQPAGFGDLALRFERSRRGSRPRACSTPRRKRPLPARPRDDRRRHAPTGAVWHDVCRVLARRWPLARVVLGACQVQGEGAPQSIVAAFGRLARYVEALPRRRPARRRAGRR